MLQAWRSQQIRIALCLLLLGSLAQTAVAEEQAGKKIQFNRDIRALLFDRCVACHGPDPNHRGADLRLDEEDAAKEYAIVPGDPDASEIIARITHEDPEMRMPPPESGKSLTEDEVALLRRWIEEGAEWQPHWAFIAPERPEPPTVQDADWPRNEIDQFILAQLEEHGLKPSPQASKEMLIRRVTLDLIGLPPTLEELDAFLADNSPDAYEKVVDRLLQSPHYGEQMAVDWLQGARFADSNGYQNDFRREQWPWRNWVIDAFNNNMPFDQFTLEQFAGDLLPNPERDQIVATGFHRNNRTVTEAGSISEEWRVENVIDRVETTSAMYLGLTMGCSRCHDHKYDPISQKEFYRFYAFFDSIDEQGVYTETRGNVPPLITLDTPEDREKLKEFDGQIQEAEQTLQNEGAGQLAAYLESLQNISAQGTAPAPRFSLPLNGDLNVLAGEPVTLDVSASDEPVAATTITATYQDAKDPIEFVEGLTGKALRLRSRLESRLDLGKTIQPDWNTPFAYSIWTRPNSGNGAVISRMGDADQSRGWDTLLLGDNKLKIHLVNSWPDNAIAVVTKNKLPKDHWSHVAVSYDGSGKAAGVQIYINGALQEVDVERDSLTGTIVADESVWLGSRATQLPFHGEIARFNWFDRAVDKSEVERLIAVDLAAADGLDSSKWTEGRQKLLREFVIASDRGELPKLRDAVAKVKKDKSEYEKAIPTVMTLKDMATPRETYVLSRGAYDAPDKSERLFPDVPAMLPQMPEGETHNRMTLAKWLIDPDHPLVSRVQVNRLWQRFFGKGIVKSSENFGVQCDPPSHPELLDWLATTFVKEGWDLKAMQKLIVMSATYQQTSDASESSLQADPDNVLLSRGPRFRMSAEAIRDNALAISGLLTHKIGGPSVKPYQPEGLWEELAGGANEGLYVQSKGADLYRRCLYTNRKRTVPHTTMSTFDAPSFEICTVKRAITNTPLQSLALLNDVTYVEAARKLAERMILEGGDSAKDRVRHGFRRATSRWPQEQEEKVLIRALERYVSSFENDENAAREMIGHGESPRDESIPVSELAAYTLVGAVLLNLDETITKQ